MPPSLHACGLPLCGLLGSRAGQEGVPGEQRASTWKGPNPDLPQRESELTVGPVWEQFPFVSLTNTKAQIRGATLGSQVAQSTTLPTEGREDLFPHFWSKTTFLQGCSLHISPLQPLFSVFKLILAGCGVLEGGESRKRYPFPSFKLQPGICLGLLLLFLPQDVPGAAVHCGPGLGTCGGQTSGPTWDELMS